MSIQSEIDRIKNNVTGVYSAVSEMGGTIPTEQNSNNLAGAVRSIPQGTQFSVDDTLEMSEDNVLSVTTPVKSILTQDEFDALTEEKQNSGLYIISGEGGQSTDFVSKDEFDEALAEKQDKLTGTEGQVVGFDAFGNAVAQEPDVTMEQVNEAIQNAITGAMEASY